MGAPRKPRSNSGDSDDNPDQARLDRLLEEQARLLDEPADDSMSQRQRLADVRSRIYAVMARMAKKTSDRVAYERLATEAATEGRQCAKAASVDALRKLLSQRDQELATAAAFAALKARKRQD